MNHTGAEYTLTRSETPGFWQRQFRIGDLVRSGKTEPMFLLLAQRRVQLRIANKARDAPIDVVVGVRIFLPLSAHSRCPTGVRSILL